MDEMEQSLRIRVENAIEALILLLDEIDGDPDMEDVFDQEAIDEREPNDGHAD